MFEQDFSERKDERAPSIEDKEFLKQVKEGIRLNTADEHYEIPLPFKDEDIKLPNNRS